MYSGESTFEIEITALNNVETKYKLIYPTTEGISIVYASDENEPSFGGILTTRKISIMATNTTDSNIRVNLGVSGGYNHNEVSEVIVPENYSEVSSSYIKYDYEILSLFIDGVRVTGFTSK